jgi:hypothetical protein
VGAAVTISGGGIGPGSAHSMRSPFMVTASASCGSLSLSPLPAIDDEDRSGHERPPGVACACAPRAAPAAPAAFSAASAARVLLLAAGALTLGPRARAPSRFASRRTRSRLNQQLPMVKDASQITSEHVQEAFRIPPDAGDAESSMCPA